MADVFYESVSELATLTNSFTTAGIPADPDMVTLAVTTPAGITATYTYGVDGELSQPGVGVYTADIVCSEDGLWSFLWTGTGAASDVTSGTWVVFPSDRRNLYTSLETLKLSIGVTHTDDDTVLLQNLAAAARSIDAHCGRRFYADGAVTARTYRPAGRVTGDSGDGPTFLVDDIATATGLVVSTGTAGGTSWTTTTDYETDPDNAIVQGRPITGLRFYGASAGMFYAQTRLRVTAAWGWPQVPDVVVQATLLQAARLYGRKDSPHGVAGNAEWGVIRLPRIDPDVQALVQHLVIPGFA